MTPSRIWRDQMALCSWWLHLAARVGARLTGNQLEWDESFSYDPLFSDR
jgi:hypothetical protein